MKLIIQFWTECHFEFNDLKLPIDFIAGFHNQEKEVEISLEQIEIISNHFDIMIRNIPLEEKKSSSPKTFIRVLCIAPRGRGFGQRG